MAHDLASGIIAAAILPFKKDSAIDWTTLERYIAQVARGRPRAIAMNMAVSEVSSLEIGEQLEVLRRCKAVLGGDCPQVSGLYVTHTAAARELAPRLVDAGADAIVVFPPVPAFMGAVSIAMIEDYHRAVAEAVDVPLLAFQTNFANYPKGAITALSRIPQVVSIKDASFDMDQTISNLTEAIAAPRKIGILTGSDTFILEAMLMGCDGALVGFAATATAELVRMQALAAAGEITEAYEIWHKLGPLARICWRSPFRDYRVRMKYVLMRQGVIPDMTVRAPFPTLAGEDRADIDRVFAEHDLGNPRFLPAGLAHGRAPQPAVAVRPAVVTP
ncbi:MAG: dihydrodipicolinate synthase family protein [Betaproteobacteria bacterium]|nr:dihydrodipicolinate synthase family protein [Betaproteobacteria bacterium]